MSEGINLRSSLSHYYLLFCAVNSQLKRNDAALIAAKNGNSQLKNNAGSMLRLVSKSRMQIDPIAVELLREVSSLDNSASNLVVD